jgi:hypothetical protein
VSLEHPVPLSELGTSNNHLAAVADHTIGPGTLEVGEHKPVTGKWLRYWAYFRLNVDESAFDAWNTQFGLTVPAGRYHDFNMWVATEGGELQRLAFNVPINRGERSEEGADITCAGGVATVVTSFPWEAGDRMEVKGASTSGLNGDWTVASASTDGPFTATYSIGTCPASTGNATVSKIRDQLARFWYQHATSDTLPAASGPVRFTGTNGVVIPANQLVSIETGDEKCGTQTYRTAASVTIASGSAAVSVDADEGGPCGNAPPAHPVSISRAGVNPTGMVLAPGLAGGAPVNSGNLIAYTRWFHWLRGTNLLDLSGQSSAQDAANNPVIFQQP